MTIINQENGEILVQNVKVSSLETLFLSIEHALKTNEIEPQRIFFKNIPQESKKKLLSKDWYWNGSKLEIYQD
ncbi:hypothetical protein [Helicobacter pullorum]|uniref:hypothetical protein n=1 Tax=Helicobacter pullorum TaxID=35818 RepID=UPI001D2636BD|nr:hypothetical protein [Helicobacter pullorum]HJF82736.1 hypothetical protein [Helicobacter pullorum]